MIVDISKNSAKSAARILYDFHIKELDKLPPNYSTASKEEREKMIYHEKAALIYIHTFSRL